MGTSSPELNVLRAVGRELLEASRRVAWIN